MTVPGGTSTTKVYPLDEDTRATFTAKAPSMADVIEQFTDNCQIPSVSSRQDCGKGVTMAFANAGKLPVTFTVTKDGKPLAPVTVPEGGSSLQTYALEENTTATFTVSAPGFNPEPTIYTQDCQNPLTSIDLTCAPNGLAVTLTNLGGEQPVGFTVVVNDITKKVAVPANGNHVESFAIAEDAIAQVTVTAPATPDTVATLRRDCQIPTAALGQSCGLGGVLATLANSGTEPVTFTLTKGGLPLGTVTVDGGKTDTRTYLIAEDEKAAVVASAPGMTPITLAAIRACPEVLGIQLGNPATLPATGTRAHDMALFAAGLAAVGLALRRLTRRSERAA